MKQRAYREGEPAVSQIELDEETRKRILEDLVVDGDLDWIPETIHITRVDHRAIGVPDELISPSRWILVMA